jgi:putative DNA methylase
MPNIKHKTERRLPHWCVRGRAHFVTFRLADTVPRGVIDEWSALRDAECERLLRGGMPIRQIDELLHKRAFAWYDRYLDAAEQPRRWLSDPSIASLVRDALWYFHGDRYALLSYSIMPNHVHALLQLSRSEWERAGDSVLGEAPTQGESADCWSPLARVMHSWKSFTANRGNALLGRTGAFWHQESYDHWIRDEEELRRVVNYIAANPVKAGLCGGAEEFRWSSAYELAQRGDNPRGLLSKFLP